MSEEERVVREFYEAFNAGDLERSGAQVAEECEFEYLAYGSAATERTREDVLDGLRGLRASFPDMRAEPINVITSGQTVVLEWDARGTWTGAPMRGKQPNGRRFEQRGCSVYELENGKIARGRDYFDRANMWQPLGLMHAFDE